jgi:hypothetical protein
MKRPSFQFYPGDWQSNTNLRRCAHVEKGIWIDVMCVMHDAQEYGVLRWSLKEIAQAVGCSVNALRAIVEKGVLKGADKGSNCQAFIYVPRSGRRDGDPVTLIAEQPGPIWYSSRMVRDEYIRTIRGESSRFGEGNDEASKGSSKDVPKASPKPPFGDGSSSSSSSSSSKVKPLPEKSGEAMPAGFVQFWETWPRSQRKECKAECLKRWKAKGLEAIAAQIIAHVEVAKNSKKWQDGYEPAPLTYINQKRWEDVGDLSTHAGEGRDWE